MAIGALYPLALAQQRPPVDHLDHPLVGLDDVGEVLQCLQGDLGPRRQRLAPRPDHVAVIEAGLLRGQPMLGHHLVHRGPEIVLRDRGRPTTK